MRTKKKLAFIMALCFIFTMFPNINAYALNIGDKLGNVLNSDIKAYIDGNRIPCYNVNNHTVVVVADLANYGFDVKWDSANRTSSVTLNTSKAKTPLSVQDNLNKPGTVAFPYVHTDIVAYINGRPVTSFNINGNLVVYFSELSPYGTFQWDEVSRTSKFTTNKTTNPTTPTNPTNPTNPGTPSIGNKLGDVLNTDIKAYINGSRIPCYNINNQTVVVVADLANYGFDVKWDGTNRTSSVAFNPSKNATPLTAQNNTNTPGTVAFPYVYTDIVAYVNGSAVESYNINGDTVIYFSALEPYGTFQWDNVARTSSFSTGYTLSGKITDSNGSGLSDVTVNLKNSSGTIITKTFTGSNGVYTFSNIQKGSYIVEANITGYTKNTQSVNLTGDYSAVNISVQKASVAISGTITDKETSAGISNASVLLKSSSGTTIQTTRTRANGTYTFSDVAQGTYYVEATMDDYNDGKTSQFTVSSSNVSNRNISLTKNTFSVTGRITSYDTGTGLAATVKLRNSGKTLIDTVTASSNGTYTFTDVPAGTYYVEASMKNYVTDTTNNFNVSGNVTNRNISLIVEGYTISGRIYGYDTSSSGLSYATVKLKNSSSSSSSSVIATTTADYNGSYSFTGISNGTYYIEASMSNSSYSTKTSSAFTVYNYNVTTNLTLDRPGLTYSGKVYDATTSAPIYSAMVVLKNASGSTVGNAVYTTSDGSFSLTGITANNYYTIEVTHTGSGYSKHTVTQFYMTSDKTGTTIYLSRDITVSGTVRESGNTSQYISNAILTFTNISTNAKYTAYSTNGSYSATMPAGTYTVTATCSGYQNYTYSYLYVATSNITHNVDMTKTGFTLTCIIAAPVGFDYSKVMLELSGPSNYSRILKGTTGSTIITFTDVPAGTGYTIKGYYDGIDFKANGNVINISVSGSMTSSTITYVAVE